MSYCLSSQNWTVRLFSGRGGARLFLNKTGYVICSAGGAPIAHVRSGHWLVKMFWKFEPATPRRACPGLSTQRQVNGVVWWREIFIVDT